MVRWVSWFLALARLVTISVEVWELCQRSYREPSEVFRSASYHAVDEEIYSLPTVGDTFLVVDDHIIAVCENSGVRLVLVRRLIIIKKPSFFSFTLVSILVFSTVIFLDWAGTLPVSTLWGYVDYSHRLVVVVKGFVEGDAISTGGEERYCDDRYCFVGFVIDR